MSDFERFSYRDEGDEERLIIESGEQIQPFLPGSVYTTEGMIKLPSKSPIVWSQIHEVFDVGLLQIGLQELIKIPVHKDPFRVTYSITPLIPIPVLILNETVYVDEMFECSMTYGDNYARMTPTRTNIPEILIFNNYFMNGEKQKYVALDNEDEITKAVYTLEHTII